MMTQRETMMRVIRAQIELPRERVLRESGLSIMLQSTPESRLRAIVAEYAAMREGARRESANG